MKHEPATANYLLRRLVSLASDVGLKEGYFKKPVNRFTTSRIPAKAPKALNFAEDGAWSGEDYWSQFHL